jgi:hypothetical protein
VHIRAGRKRIRCPQWLTTDTLSFAPSEILANAPGISAEEFKVEVLNVKVPNAQRS